MITNTQPFSLEGPWSGKLSVGPVHLTVILKISKVESGHLGALLDCLEQKMQNFPVDSIIQNGNEVQFEIKRLGLNFKGSLDSYSHQISGIFEQHGTKLPITFSQGEASVEKMNRPQEPKAPYTYREIEVSYQNPLGEHTLSGTLTLPQSSGPFPVALFITGSGPHDRDENIFGHKPFLVLADYLTQKGIACLRVDDRGVGKSTGKFENATTEDFSSDVLAGIDFLKTQSEINSQQIGLIGHSEGGLIAPMVASRSNDVAFIVMLAGPGVTGEEVLIKQAELILQAAGASKDKISYDKIMRAKSFEIIREESNPQIAEQRLRETITKLKSELPQSLGMAPSDIAEMDFTEAQIESAIRNMNSAWFRFFLSYDPRTVLKKLKIPVLVLNGECDLQVSPKQNLPELEKALKVSETQDYTLIEFPKLNHLFQTCQTGSIEEYGQIEETVAPVVLKTISDWILERINMRLPI